MEVQTATWKIVSQIHEFQYNWVKICSGLDSAKIGCEVAAGTTNKLIVGARRVRNLVYPGNGKILSGKGNATRICTLTVTVLDETQHIK